MAEPARTVDATVRGFKRLSTSITRKSSRGCGKACFKRYNQDLGVLGGNDLGVAHASSETRKKGAVAAKGGHDQEAL